MAPGTTLTAPRQVEGATLKILAGDVFESLPAGPEIDAVPDFGVAGNGSNILVAEMRNEVRYGVAGNDGIGVHADENRLVVAQVLKPEIESPRFATVGLGDDNQMPRRSLEWCHLGATSSVLSVEPSSITITRRLG